MKNDKTHNAELAEGANDTTVVPASSAIARHTEGRVTVRCSKCAQEFNPTPHQVAKHDYQCRPCKREYDAKWRRRRAAAGLPARGATPKEWLGRYLASYYARPEIRQRRAASMRVYSKLPHVAPKVAARKAVRNAIQRGEMHRQPCQVCGDVKTQAHHADYSRPLDVTWLCRPHHRAEHAKAEGRS